MKRFICLMIFAIGLFVSLPERSSGSGSPPDQAWITMNHVTFDMPAMDIQVMDVTPETFVINNLLSQGCLQEEGGCFVGDQGLFLESPLNFITDRQLNDSTLIYQSCSLDVRTCYDMDGANNQNLQDNMVSAGVVTIRADSWI